MLPSLQSTLPLAYLCQLYDISEEVKGNKFNPMVSGVSKEIYLRASLGCKYQQGRSRAWWLSVSISLPSILSVDGERVKASLGGARPGDTDRKLLQGFDITMQMEWPCPDFDVGALDPGTHDHPLTSRGGRMKGYRVLNHNRRDSNLNMQEYQD